MVFLRTTFVVLLVYFVHIQGIQTEDVTVTTNVGSIKGKTVNVTYNGTITKQIVEFLGIPFAEKPVRFAAPLAKANFTDVFDASSFGLPCPQYNNFTTVEMPTEMTEDCLSLNIFTPDVKSSSSYPVMIFIYGGGFVIGESEPYNGHILTAYGDVVLVTINYRLGAFGFLSTEDVNAPGNYGLWDQHLGIKWVKDNIEDFGGDSSTMTLFGESAGAGSVSHQLNYLGNKGLFQRAILESGSANAFWGDLGSGVPAYNARTLATRAGCDIPEQNSGVDIIKCLRGIQNFTKIAVLSSFLSWGPRIDESIVTTDGLNSIKWPSIGKDEGVFKDYDVIVGTNGYEGYFFLELNYKQTVEEIKVASRDEAKVIFEGFIKGLLGVQMFGTPVETINAITQAVLIQYTDAEHPHDREFTLKQLSDFMTDTWFFYPGFKDVSAHSHKNNISKTYQYEFNHMWPFDSNTWRNGAAHGEELGYVFGHPPSLLYFFNFTQEQALSEWPTSKITIDYWTNFAKTGNPNLPRPTKTEWKEYNNHNQDYIYFPITGNPESKQHLNARRTAFWKEYVPKLMEARPTTEAPVTCKSTSSSSIIQVNNIVYSFAILIFCMLNIVSV